MAYSDAHWKIAANMINCGHSAVAVAMVLKMDNSYLSGLMRNPESTISKFITVGGSCKSVDYAKADTLHISMTDDDNKVKLAANRDIISWDADSVGSVEVKVSLTDDQLDEKWKRVLSSK